MKLTLIRVSIAMLAVTALTSCIPNLVLPADASIEVQLHFARQHTNVSATWSGEMVSSRYSSREFPDSDDTASASMPVTAEVSPADLLKFEPVRNLIPGRWDLAIEVREGGTTLATIRCRDLNLGADDFGTARPYVVRWLEDPNRCIFAYGMADPVRPHRDASVEAFAAPPAAVIGANVGISVGVRNRGDIIENVNVAVQATPPGGGTPIEVGSLVRNLNANGGEAVVNFFWNSDCLPEAGDYTLSATVSVPEDSDRSNDTRTRTIPMRADREILLRNPVGPATAQKNRPGGTAYSVTIVNGSFQSEINIGIDDEDVSAVEPPGAIQWYAGSVPPVTLACGESKELNFAYFPPSVGPGGAHTLSLTLLPAAPIPGDEPANNTIAIPITVTP